MGDKSKNREQLLAEVAALRQQVSDLDTAQSRLRREVDALSRSEARLRNLVNSVDDIIFTLDTAQRHTGVFGRWLADANISPEFFLGKTAVDIFGPEIGAMHRAANQKALQGEHVLYEWSMTGPNGLQTIQTSLSPVFDDAGQVVGLTGIGRDITDIRLAEQALQQSQERFQMLFDTMLDGYALHEIICDEAGKPVDYRFLEVNPAWERFTGHRRKDVLGKTVLEVIPEIEPYWIETYGKVALTGESVKFENFAGGVGNKWFEVVAFQTKQNHFAVVFQETTRQKLAEEALRRERDLLRSIMETSPVSIVMLSPAGEIVFANSKAEETLGLERAEMTQRTYNAPDWGIAADFAGRPLADDELPFQRVMSSGKVVYDVQHTIQNPEGKRRLLSINAAPVMGKDNEIEGVIAVLEDITERKQAEIALQRYADRLENLREIDLSILAAQSLEELTTGTLQRLRRLVPARRVSLTLFDLEQNKAELLAADVAGETDLLANSTFSLHNPDVLRNLQRDEVHIVTDLRHVKGTSRTEQKLLQEGVAAYVNVPLIAQGQLIGSLNIGLTEEQELVPENLDIAREVSSQLAIALQQARLHEQIQQYASELEQRVAVRTAELEAANKHLSALSRVKDEFVANVSHELRSPITGLQLQLHLLDRKPEQTAQYLASMMREIGRLERTVEDLLQLSRLDQEQQDLSFSDVDVNKLVADYVADRALLAAEKELELFSVLTPDRLQVQADAGLIEQVLGILVSNALNYTPAGGTITVTVESWQHNGRFWGGFSVADTGPGISAQEQKNIFERFFRGKVANASRISGTGLGLALAKEIVTRHQGQIEVESKGIPGEGTRFIVWLPTVQA